VDIEKSSDRSMLFLRIKQLTVGVCMTWLKRLDEFVRFAKGGWVMMKKTIIGACK